MTVFYGNEATKYLNTTPVVLESGALVAGRTRRYRGSFTMASQATTDTIVLMKVPAGVAFAYGVITASATMGATATVAIGITGATGKYRTAAVYTAANTPTMFGNVAAIEAAALTAEETIFITIAAASLPAAGTVVVDMFFSGT